MRRLMIGLLLFAVATCVACSSRRQNESNLKRDVVQVVQGRVEAPDRRSRTRNVSQLIAPPSVVPQFVAGTTTSLSSEASRGQILNEPSISEESRDADWAAPTETAVRGMTARIPYVDATTVTVLCGASVCQVTGRLQTGLSDANRRTANGAIMEESFYSGAADLNVIPSRSSVDVGEQGAFVLKFARLHK